MGDRPAAFRTAQAYTFLVTNPKSSGLADTFPLPGLYRAYNGVMARGWESKSVEQQQEETKSSTGRKGKQLTAEQIAAHRRRRGLELSRKRILQQLELATNPQHKKMLETALADLNSQLNGQA